VLSVAALLAVRFDGRAFTASRALRRTEQVGLVALGLACLWMSWHVLAHPTAAPINAQSPVALAMFSREPAERELPAGTPTPADWGPPGDFTPQWKPIEKISRRFNVILMVMESVRDDVVWPSPTAVPMPRLAALAPNAAVFTRAYAHAPRSRKALEALMFGVYPTTSWRGQKVVKEGFGLESLPEAWKKAGLRTAFLTPWETGFDRFGDVVANRGFETVLDSGTLGGPDDGALVPALDRFLEKSSAPFGAILWTRQTHGPYKLPPPKVNRSPLNTFEAYRETIEYTDGVIGDLVDMLKRRGRWEDTVLILVGDHGQSFDEHFDSGHGHGRRVYETSSRVPLLFINPVLFHGERDDRVVEQMDVCATAAWLAGDERRQFNVGSVVFLQKPSATAYLLNTFDGFAGGVVVNELKYSYGAGEDNQPAVERLFDVVADPGELHDLSAQRRPEAEALKRRFFGWYSTWQGRWEGVSYLPQNSGSSAVRETLLGSAR
jgi:arylsulfatase A-like enzyme